MLRRYYVPIARSRHIRPFRSRSFERAQDAARVGLEFKSLGSVLRATPSDSTLALQRRARC